MEVFKNLLLNFLVIICPIYYYLHFIIERGKSTSGSEHRTTVTIVGLVSIILCISFPVGPTPGFRMDLRMIPFILCGLTGRVEAIVLFVGMTVYRMILGGEGFYSSTIANSILLAIMLWMMDQFREYAALKKFRTVMLLSAIGIMLYTFFGFFFMTGLSNEQYAMLTLNLIVIQMAGMYVSVKIIEFMSRNRMMTEEIHHIEKLKVVSNLAASISHEIRNPLTVAKGFIQLMKESEQDKEKEVRYNLILSELKRAEDIITDFLSLAKPQQGNYESLHVEHEVGHVVDLLTPYATLHHVSVHYGIEHRETETYILGDRSKLHQCLINLMKNSIEAMMNRGELSICTRRNRETNDIEIEIRDNGRGMSEDEVNRLGAPFYSTKAKGTGLGTMVAFHLVEVMNGTKKIESVKDRGTTITLRFPIQTKAS